MSYLRFTFCSTLVTLTGSDCVNISIHNLIHHSIAEIGLSVSIHKSVEIDSSISVLRSLSLSVIFSLFYLLGDSCEGRTLIELEESGIRRGDSFCHRTPVARPSFCHLRESGRNVGKSKWQKQFHTSIDNCHVWDGKPRCCQLFITSDSVEHTIKPKNKVENKVVFNRIL